MPDVTGRLVEEIKKPLAEKKFEIGRVTTRESDRPRGTVLAQLPVSGTKTACGAQIAVMVAVPPPNYGETQPERCVVPGLTGSEIDKVQSPLARADLVLGSVRNRTFDGRAGTILAQQPQAGTRVLCRTQVDVLVAVAPTVTCAPMPRLIGRDTKTAASLLESSGRRLGTVDERESNDAVGVILEQAPSAGANVTCDTPVRVWVATPPAGVPVPMLLRNDERSARSALERVGLAMGEIAQRPSDQQTGSVVEQSPAAGTVVKRGSPVQVWLATTPLVTVPDVRGMNRATAVDTLTSARLRLGDVTDRPSDRAAGTIVEQTPAPGTAVGAGSVVQVGLAVPLPATVPDVRGKDRVAAAQILTTARLRLGEVGERQSDRAEATVVDQTPAPGTPLRQGSAVQVWLAVPLPATVPDLRGDDRVSAADALTKVRLRLGEVGERQSNSAVGSVVEQVPAPGTSALAGTEVQVWLAVPITIEVPDLAGRTRPDAERMLSDLGLVLRATTGEPSASTTGTVLRQAPAAGARVSPATAVDLVLATAIPVPTLLTPVPNIIGLSRDEARGVLQAAGLQMGSVREIRARTAVGTVTSQEPRAGTSVSPGAAVDFEVATFDFALLWMLAAGLGLGAAAAGMVSRARKGGSEPPPAVTLAPHADSGVQTTVPDSRGLASSELSLQGFADEGIQMLDVSGATR